MDKVKIYKILKKIYKDKTGEELSGQVELRTDSKSVGYKSFPNPTGSRIIVFNDKNTKTETSISVRNSPSKSDQEIAEKLFKKIAEKQISARPRSILSRVFSAFKKFITKTER